MPALKKYIKSLIAHVLYYSGLLRIYAHIRLKERAVVLTYHRVLNSDEISQSNSNPGIVVHTGIFREHMSTLGKFFNVVPIGIFEKHLMSGSSFPDRCCLVTFDDGWLDNHQNAFPILREYMIPAHIFLPCNYIESEHMFWQEELNLRLTILARSSRKADQQLLLDFCSTTDIPDRDGIFDYISRLKNESYEDINNKLDQLRKYQADIRLPPHNNRYMNWGQVREMQSGHISFGSHALTHRVLPRLPDSEITTELVESRIMLETMLDTEITTIAYPNGDVNDVVQSTTKDAGYTLGFSTEKGLVTSSTPRFALPRVNIHTGSSYNKAVFLCSVLGIF